MIPLISLIIPTKNEAKNLDRLLTSITNQTLKTNTYEIIVVDNHSTDNTLFIAKKFGAKTLRGGPERSAQRNAGAKIARGRYLFFVDADMELSPSLIQNIVQVMKQNPKSAGDQFVQAASTRVSLEKNNQIKYTGNSNRLQPNKLLLPSAHDSQLILTIPEIGHGTNFWEKVMALDKNCAQNIPELQAARVFPKKLFQSVGGYDETLYAAEDWDLHLRCQQRGATTTQINQTITHHESIPNLKALFTKEDYYVKNIGYFANKHPQFFRQVASPKFRAVVYLKNLPILATDPVHALALTAYKITLFFWSKIVLLQSNA